MFTYYILKEEEMITGGIITILEQNLERMTEFPIDFRNRTLYAEKQ